VMHRGMVADLVVADERREQIGTSPG
jgi:hypothetical protein